MLYVFSYNQAEHQTLKQLNQHILKNQNVYKSLYLIQDHQEYKNSKYYLGIYCRHQRIL